MADTNTASATIRILANGAAIASVHIAAKRTDNTFTIPAGPAADLLGQWKPGMTVELLVGNGRRATRLVCDEPKFQEDESVILDAKAVTP